MSNILDSGCQSECGSERCRSVFEFSSCQRGYQAKLKVKPFFICTNAACVRRMLFYIVVLSQHGLCAWLWPSRRSWRKQQKLGNWEKPGLRSPAQSRALVGEGRQFGRVQQRGDQLQRLPGGQGGAGLPSELFRISRRLREAAELQQWRQQ